MHSNHCMRTLDISCHFQDPNQNVNERSNFGHILDVVEDMRSKGIHEVYSPELNKELSFLYLMGEIQGKPVQEAIGVTKWIQQTEAEMGYTPVIPQPKPSSRALRATVSAFNPKLSSTNRPRAEALGRYGGESQQQHRRSWLHIITTHWCTIPMSGTLKSELKGVVLVMIG